MFVFSHIYKFKIDIEILLKLHIIFVILLLLKIVNIQITLFETTNSTPTHSENIESAKYSILHAHKLGF